MGDDSKRPDKELPSEDLDIDPLVNFIRKIDTNEKIRRRLLAALEKANSIPDDDAKTETVLPDILPENVEKFPAVQEWQAQFIVTRNCGVPLGDYPCFSKKPSDFNLYLNTKDPCWYVVVPWPEQNSTIRSSRVVVISRRTAEILYDGTAGDEG